MSQNRNEDIRYKPGNVPPGCFHHAGGDTYCSDVCVCYMSDGRFELLRYYENDSCMEESGWQDSENKDASVDCWMEC